MPTVSGMRRRGYTPTAIRNFCQTIGITKFNGFTDVALLEYSVREDLNANAPRRMAVLNPLKLTITTLPEDAEEMVEVQNNPEKPEEGFRQVPLTREIWIERDDFMLDPPKKYFRLAPGRTVRLRGGYCVTCTDYRQDADSNITEIFCEHIPGTIGSNPPEGIQCRAAHPLGQHPPRRGRGNPHLRPPVHGGKPGRGRKRIPLRHESRLPDRHHRSQAGTRPGRGGTRIQLPV